MSEVRPSTGSVARRLALAAALVLLAGCTSMGTFGRFLGGEVIVTEPELQQRLDRRFPREFETGGGIVTVTLDQPQAQLQGEQLRLAFDVEATVPGLRMRPRGHFALVSGLRFDAERQSLYLHEPRLVRLDLPPLPGLPVGDDLLALGDALLAQVAQDAPVYVLSERRQAQIPLGRSVYRVDIEDGRIVIGVQR